VQETMCPPKDKLTEEILAHWREHSKSLWQAYLKEPEKWRQVAQSQAESTLRYDEFLRRAGWDRVQAWSEAMREHALNLK